MTRAATQRTIGERIVWARKRKGISQDRLAVQIGTTRRHIIRLEKNVHAPKQPMLQKLAVALDQAPEFFSLDEDEEADPLPSLDEMLRSHVRMLVREEWRRMETVA